MEEETCQKQHLAKIPPAQLLPGRGQKWTIVNLCVGHWHVGRTGCKVDVIHAYIITYHHISIPTSCAPAWAANMKPQVLSSPRRSDCGFTWPLYMTPSSKNRSIKSWASGAEVRNPHISRIPQKSNNSSRLLVGQCGPTAVERPSGRTLM
jgi:hypothetical protein